MTNIAIKVENISKAYRIGLKEERQKTLTGALTTEEKLFPFFHPLVR